jgi:hypothetical protein
VTDALDQMLVMSPRRYYKGWLTLPPFPALQGRHGHVDFSGVNILDGGAGR